jgi:hypothetical protein
VCSSDLIALQREYAMRMEKGLGCSIMMLIDCF